MEYKGKLKNNDPRIDLDVCVKFYDKPGENPISGRRIQYKRDVYNILDRTCKSKYDIDVSNKLKRNIKDIKPINPAINRDINLPKHINQPIHLSKPINQPINRPINLPKPINQPINRPKHINLPINLSKPTNPPKHINKPIDQHINQPINQPKYMNQPINLPKPKLINQYTNQPINLHKHINRPKPKPINQPINQPKYMNQTKYMNQSINIPKPVYQTKYMNQPINIPKPVYQGVISESFDSKQNVSMPSIKSPGQIKYETKAPPTLPYRDMNQPYSKNVELYSFDPAQKELLGDHLNNTPELMAECIDKVGKDIFDIFVQKYKTDDVFGRQRRNLQTLFSSRSLTKPDYDMLLINISEYQQRYDEFIEWVNKDRKFIEKSGSGNKPRKIKTSKDWAEAIIELQDTINKFEPIFKPIIDMKKDPKHIAEYCQGESYDKCPYPCDKESYFIFGKGKCTYK